MKLRAEQAVAVMSVFTLCLMTGCGGFFVYPGSQNTGGNSSTGDYVYVANATTSTLTGFSVGTGTLKAVSGSPYALLFVPTAVVVNPANSIVFVAGNNGISGFINSYSIGSGGALSLLVSNNVGSAGEVSMDVSPDGNWLLGLDSNGPAVNQAIVDEYQINSSTGALTLKTGTSYTFPSGTPTIVPRAIKFSPGNGQYVFAALGTAGDLVFNFSTSNGSFTNSLVTLATGTTTQSDNSLAVTSINSNLYLYIARSNSQSAGAILAYSVGSGGLPAYLGQAPTGVQPDSVVVSRDSTDIYVSNRSDGNISEFSIASDATATVLNPATYSSGLGSFPVAMVVDKSGNYLLAIANGGNPDLSLYSYDSAAAGQLKFAASTPSGTDPAGAVAIAATH